MDADEHRWIRRGEATAKRESRPAPMSDMPGSTLQAAANRIVFHPIGIIHSGHQLAEWTPVQPVYARGTSGRAEILPAYRDGLEGLAGFSHVFLLYHFHRAEPPELRVQPFTGDHPCGVFATRHPQRPNGIGLSLVRLVRIEDLVLHLEGVDILDGTPLLDLKPFIPRFDCVEGARGGWTETVDDATARRRGERRLHP